MSKPVEIEYLAKDSLSPVIDDVGAKTDMLPKNASEVSKAYELMTQQISKGMVAIRGDIALLESELEGLRLVMATSSPDLDQTENCIAIEQLENHIKELKNKLLDLERVSNSIDIVPPDVEQSKRKVNGLHNSIQQMAREMPSLAMGPQTFFLAISNNLPIFTDEVARARKEYNNLIQTGQKATPVWKQILSSLFSWQTALTTGIMLLVMYGDEIVEWTKDIFSAKKGVEEFTISFEEMTEIEKDGRAQMIQTRFEIDSVIASLKDFTGSKEEEKAKVEELNRKYGEAFGYYDTVAQWYDVLIQKSEDYIQMLFLQAKAQAMVNKAVEADAELQKLKQQKPGDADSDMNWFARMGHHAMAAEMSQAGQYYDAQGTIDKYNQEAYEEMLRQAEAKVQGYLDEAQALTEQAAEVGQNMDIGGHTKPNAPKTDPQKEVERRLALEKEQAEELRQLRWDNEQAEIDQMKDGSEKRIRQIQLDYEKAIAEIEKQEARWKEAQGGVLTEEQQAEIDEAKELAKEQKNQDEELVKEEEISKQREKLNALLDEYKSYDQRRRDIDEAYRKDMAMYDAELEKLRNSGDDTSDVEESQKARTDAYKKEIQSLENDILRSTDFYDKLFSEISQKGYKVLKNFYKEAKHVLDDAKVDAEGVEIEIPVKDPEGNIIKKKVRVTIAEFERMKQQVEKINDELEKKNPFYAFKQSFSDLTSAIKNGGDVSGALNALKSAGDELLSTVQGWGQNLNTIFGGSYGEAIDEIGQAVGGIMDMGVGLGQLFSGDIVGGITNVLNGVASIVELEQKAKERLVEIEIINIKVNRAIRERNEELARNLDTIHNIIQEQELLNWLVEKGFAKPNSVSVWEANSAALQEYIKNLKAESQAYDDLRAQLDNSTATVGGYDGCLSWSWETFSLAGKTAEEIQGLYEQGALDGNAAKIYEAWVESGKSIEELKKNIEETYATMQEMVMGTSFDGFLNNVGNALREARGDVRKFADFAEETIANGLFEAFKYQYLADAIKPLYDELSKAFIDGTATEDYLDEWKRTFENTMKEANDHLEQIGETAGVDPYYDSATTQTGKSGAFSAMSQEQGTKLEGLFVSGQMHWASIDERSEDISESMRVAENHLAKIEENTGDCAKELKEVKEEIKKLNRDGLKVK